MARHEREVCATAATTSRCRRQLDATRLPTRRRRAELRRRDVGGRGKLSEKRRTVVVDHVRRVASVIGVVAAPQCRHEHSAPALRGVPPASTPQLRWLRRTPTHHCSAWPRTSTRASVAVDVGGVRLGAKSRPSMSAHGRNDDDARRRVTRNSADVDVAGAKVDVEIDESDDDGESGAVAAPMHCATTDDACGVRDTEQRSSGRSLSYAVEHERQEASSRQQQRRRRARRRRRRRRRRCRRRPRHARHIEQRRRRLGRVSKARDERRRRLLRADRQTDRQTDMQLSARCADSASTLNCGGERRDVASRNEQCRRRCRRQRTRCADADVRSPLRRRRQLHKPSTWTTARAAYCASHGATSAAPTTR
jgi:hypothetical protein